ncbi:hypothetical protein [Methylocystis echinoides]|uniref:Uncharacterized protein n=1 Tax=Methylocystis echinoides TaxID=29468 RepID=A0A9W6GX72_9HYPH|nr:hypothetical protein [Methylocystis echinoides]GLI94679.1 hypothetical protein LMG27198_36710 [Methylocystis echinoides]
MRSKKIEPIPEMWPVMKELKARGFRFRVCAPNHLKIGKFNFWPGTGTIHIDGTSSALQEFGLAALLKYLEEQRARANRTTATPEERRARFHVVGSSPSEIDD